MKGKKYLQKRLAILTLFSLVFGQLSPFISYAEEKEEIIKNFVYSEEQGNVGEGSIVIKNYSDTESSGTLKNNIDKALPEYFGKNDDVYIDINSPSLDAKIYGFTLGGGDEGDILHIYGSENKLAFASEVKRLAFGINITDYNKVFTNKKFVSVKIELKNGQKIEIVDLIALDILDPVIQGMITGLSGGDKEGTYQYTGDSFFINGFINAMPDSNLEFKNIKIDHIAKDNKTILGEIFKLNADSKYEWQRSGGNTLDTGEFVIKNYTDTQSGSSLKDNFDNNIDLSQKTFGAKETVIYNILNTGKSYIYGISVGGETANTAYLQGAKNIDELTESITNIEFAKNMTEYKDIFNNKEFLSVNINFKSGGSLELIDLISIDKIDPAIQVFINMIAGEGAYGTSVTDKENIKNILNTLSSFISYVGNNIISGTEEVILGAVYNVETYKLITNDIRQTKGTNAIHNYLDKEIPKDQIYKIIVSGFDTTNNNKFDLNGFRKSDQTIIIPAFNNILGKLILENVTISSSEFANDVLLLHPAITDLTLLLEQISSIKVSQALESSYYDITIKLNYGAGDIILSNVIAKDLFDSIGLTVDANGILDEQSIKTLVSMLFNITLVTETKWQEEKDLIVNHSAAASVLDAKINLETTKGLSNSGSLAIYKDEGFNDIVGEAKSINSNTKQINFDKLTPDTAYYYKLILENTFNQFIGTGSFNTTLYPTDDISSYKGSATIHNFSNLNLNQEDVLIIKVSNFDEANNNKNDLDGFRKSDQRLLLPNLSNIKGLLVIENATISSGFFANDVLILDSSITNEEELIGNISNINVSSGSGTYKTFDIGLTNSGTIQLTNIINGDNFPFSDGELSSEQIKLIVTDLYNKTLIEKTYWDSKKDLILDNVVSEVTLSGAAININITGKMDNGKLGLFKDPGFKDQVGTDIEISNEEKVVLLKDLDRLSDYYYKFVINNTFNQVIETGSFITNACESFEHLEDSICVNNFQKEIIENGIKTRQWLGTAWSPWSLTCLPNYIPEGEKCVYDNVQYPTDNLTAYKGKATTHDYSNSIILPGTIYGIRLSNFDTTNNNKFDLNGFRKSDQRILLPSFNRIAGMLVIENMTISSGYFANDVLVLDQSIKTEEELRNSITRIEVKSGSGTYKTLEVGLTNSGTIRLTNVINTKLFPFPDGELNTSEIDSIISELYNKTIFDKTYWDENKILIAVNKAIPKINNVNIELAIKGLTNSGSIALYYDEEYKNIVGEEIKIEDNTVKNIEFTNLNYSTNYYYKLILENKFNQFIGTGSFSTTQYETLDLSEYKGTAKLHNFSSFKLDKGETYQIKLSNFDTANNNKFDLKGFRKSDQRLILPPFSNIQGTLLLENITVSTGFFANDVLILDPSITNVDELYSEIARIEILEGEGTYKTINIARNSNFGEITLVNAINEKQLIPLAPYIEDNKFTDEGRKKLLSILFNVTTVTEDKWNSQKDLSMTQNVENITNSGATINAIITGLAGSGSFAIFEDPEMQTQTGETLSINTSQAINLTNLENATDYYYKFVIENTFNQVIEKGNFTTNACLDGEHLEAGICKNNVETVGIENGVKTRIWSKITNSWGEWIITCIENYRPVGDICIYDGGGDITDDLSSFKGKARLHDYSGIKVEPKDTHTIILSNFDTEHNNKFDLNGFRKSDQRLLLPELSNIKGKLTIKNITVSSSEFANDVLILDPSITNTGAIFNLIDEITIKDGQGTYVDLTFTLSNSGTILFTNAINKKHMEQFKDMIDIEGRLNPLGRGILISTLFQKTIVTKDFWEKYKDLEISQNVSNETLSGATINATIHGELNSGNLKLYIDSEYLNQTGASLSIDNTFSGTTYNELEKSFTYYYKFELANIFNLIISKGNFTTLTCENDEHLEGGICKANFEKVIIDNGEKTRTWSNGAWSSWTVTCNAGFRPMGEICVAYNSGTGGSSGSNNGPWYTQEEWDALFGTGTTAGTGTTLGTGTTIEPEITLAGKFSTNSKYYYGFVASKLFTNTSDIDKNFDFSNTESLDEIKNMQETAKNDFTQFQGLMSDPEFAYYGEKFLYGYEQILTGLKTRHSGEKDPKLLANATNQVIQGSKIYNQSLADLSTLINTNYKGVSTITIGDISVQKLIVFSKDNILGEELESKIDMQYKGKLTKDNLKEVIEARNKALIKINRILNNPIEAENTSMEELLKLIDLGDLFPKDIKDIKPTPEIDLPKDQGTIKPKQKNLLINLVKELIKDEKEQEIYLNGVDKMTKEEANYHITELIKLKTN